ncbi:MAG: S8 family serine peptidase [FCB group bacterium]|nr:S8 family serine peptidase [FCB group bacterium]
MRKLTIIALLLVLSFAVLGAAQTTKDLISSDYTKKVYIPFKKPPPSMIYYVPNEMIVQLKEVPTTQITAVQKDKEIVYLTGRTSLDELNKKYAVTKFSRQFPDTEPVDRAATVQPTDTPAPDLTRHYVIKFGEKFRLEEVLKAYAVDGHVEMTQPIGVHPVYESFPNDPYFLTDQWNFNEPNDHDIDATDAWDYETGDATVVVADLDTGLQYNMRDLGGLSPYTDGNVWINWAEYNGSPGVDDDANGYIDDWVGWDFVHGVYNVWPGEDSTKTDNEPTDFNGHGSHVGGIMGAITNNSIGVAGLAGGWNTGTNDPANGVKVMACRIGWSAPHPIYGYEVGYVRMDFAASAIYYAVNNGAMAINCSWGSSNSGGLGAAVDYAVANDVFVCAAAGNSNSQSADYLGTRADVIDVCATDSSDIKADFSNYGTWVDLSAPGVDILSTYSFHYAHYYAWVSGTSQAAPHVTAAAGFLKSHNSSLTRQEIFDIIVDNTDNIDGLNPAYAGRLGSGRLNLFKALDATYDPEITVTYPNGGEVWYIGQTQTITWDASDNVGLVQSVIEYSTDGGSNWTEIGNVPGNPGEFDWVVTGPPSSTCRVQVTGYDAVGGSGSDMSDEDFCPPYKRQTGDRGSGLAVAGEGALPDIFALYQNRPNPFNPATEINFSLPRASEATVTIYNITGQVVATPISEMLDAGYHTVVWDGKNADGRSVASGIYFYRLQAEEFVQTRKMMLVR